MSENENAPFLTDVIWLIYTTHTDMLLLISNRDGMKVEERGHHSHGHGQWKLGCQGLQVHRDQLRSNFKLGESQRKSRSNYFSPCCGGECSFRWCGLKYSIDF